MHKEISNPFRIFYICLPSPGAPLQYRTSPFRRHPVRTEKMSFSFPSGTDSPCHGAGICASAALGWIKVFRSFFASDNFLEKLFDSAVRPGLRSILKGKRWIRFLCPAEALILAEHYGEAKAWLEGDQWDTVMNYDAFMEPVTWFLTGMEKHSDEFNEGMLGNSDCFIGSMKYHMSSFYAPSLMTAMNELSNHDHSRFLTRTNHKVGRVETLGSEAAEQNVNKAVFREAVVIQMTWPGIWNIFLWEGSCTTFCSAHYEG